MSTAKILVPVDFSAQSRSALDIAGSFAIIEKAELLIAHVVEDDIEAYFPAGGVSSSEAMTGLYDVLHDVRPADESIPYTHRLIEGKPASAILKLAADENVELIVMGTHGRTGFQRMVLGSVAEEVVRKAKCPVLTLRNPIDTYDKQPAESV
jgi:nucleotide-binding universal stress UspA family protein